MTHSYKVHFFHLIWSTKGREPLITEELQPRLYAYMGGIIKNLDGALLEIGGMQDHVHLLVYLTYIDKYSSFIRDIKSNSTLWIHKNYPKMKTFAWQEGFASLSVSYSALEKVKMYIQNQKEHHKTMTFEEEYTKLLDGMHINYDKRFVFG